MVDASIIVTTHLVPTNVAVVPATNWKLTSTNAKVNLVWLIYSFEYLMDDFQKYRVRFNYFGMENIFFLEQIRPPRKNTNFDHIRPPNR